MAQATIPASVMVALYGPDGLLDRRTADNETDAVRIVVEIARERGLMRVGEHFEIEPFAYV